MIRTQESTGKTVDEAFAKACALLGVQAEDENVSREVLEYPQKTGFLGLKITPAKVRVSVELPDAPAAAPAKPVEPVAEQPVETAAPVQETAPVAEEVPAAVAEPAAPAAEQASVRAVMICTMSVYSKPACCMISAWYFVVSDTLPMRIMRRIIAVMMSSSSC